jgi:hypothetical protein
MSSTTTLSSTAVSVRLAADGKNWKDWNKQVINYAASDNAFSILDGAACPAYDPLSVRYRIETYDTGSIRDEMSETQKKNEFKRVSALNANYRILNDEARLLKKEAEQAYTNWVARDARLQNTILSSIDNALKPQVRGKATAHDMYTALRELNDNTEYANAAQAWQNFVMLRADQCKTIRAYIGKFREALIDLNTAGISFKWVKPKSTTTIDDNGVNELIVIHFLQGLDAVLPEWVEARNNDLRRDNTWTLDALVASLEDHIRHTNGEPVNTFLTISKQEEEKRVLARIRSRNSNGDTKTNLAYNATSSGGAGGNNATPRRPRASMGYCNNCNREHPGPNDACWITHPELKPANIKSQRAEALAKKNTKAETNTATAARANVTVASDDEQEDGYGVHAFNTIARVANVSPAILRKAVNDKDYKNRYCYDTAANRHVFNSKTKFIEYHPSITNDVRGSTGSTVNCGVGTVAIEVVKSDGRTELLHLKDVLYCPDFATNVICQWPFKRRGVFYHSGKDKLVTGEDEHELVYLPEIDGIPNFLVVNDSTQAPDALSYASLVAFRSSADEPLASRPAADWHHIFGHANIEAIKRTAKVVNGMELTTSSIGNCSPCGLSKAKQNISRRPQDPPARILGKVHIDIVGPITVEGMDREKYWSLKTCGKSRRQWLACSDSKAALGAELVTWCQQIKTQGLTIVTIFCDNAKELISTRNKQYFDTEGITLTTSPPYDASRNGIAERANGITENRTRSAIIAAGLPMKLWPYCAKYMVRLHNLLSSSALPDNITPLECWNKDVGYPNTIPNVAKLHAFGHPGYVFIPPQKRVKGDKFVPRAERGHLVGMKGEHIYEMWLPESDKIVTTASVKFDQYGTTAPPPSTNLPEALLPARAIAPILRDMAQAATPPASMVEDAYDDEHLDGDAFQLPEAGGGQGFDGLDENAPETPQAPALQDALLATRGNNRAPRRQEINADLNENNVVNGPRERRPRAYFTSTTFDRCFAMALIKPTVGSKLSSLPPEPRNYKQFQSHPRRPQLQVAMDEEYNALTEIGTWRPATPEEISAHGHQILPAQWVWTYKGDAQGFHTKDKARMVVCGNRQQESLWYKDVYSYVVRMTTLRIIFALVAYFDLECDAMDMITAYLNSYLEREDVILLRLPPGCKGYKNVVRLIRGMYGLRQSALMWYNDLKDSLKELGFNPIEADPCVFINAKGEIIVVYVDDLILITRDTKSIEMLKEKLLARYKARDLGPVSYYLGIRVVRDRPNRSLKLSMEGYIDRVLNEYHLGDAPIAHSPLPTSALKLAKRDPEDQADKDLVAQYQSLVAKLLYPTSIIRPDLAWHVNYMARFATNPTHEQLSLLKHILRYYKGTAALGIEYRGDRKEADINNPNHLTGLIAYSDSAHGDNQMRKSSAGYVIKMAGGVVSYKSYRQRLVTLSSTESEYIALTYAAKEIAWLQRLLSQLGYRGHDLRPFHLQTDNEPALNMIRKDGLHERTKHIDVYYKYTKQQCKDGNVRVSHCRGTEMPADGLTKPLDKLLHAKFVTLINMVKVP